MSHATGFDLAPGSTVGGYEVETLIGRGGMGAVYRAREEGLARKVALKVIAPELAADERFRERFLRESKIAASLDHPHVVPIYQGSSWESSWPVGRLPRLTVPPNHVGVIDPASKSPIKTATAERIRLSIRPPIARS